MLSIALAPPAEFSFDSAVWPIVFLMAVGSGAALLLRWSGIRQPGVLAGLVAGVVCGSTILGNTFPDLHQRWFIGASAEGVALDDLRAEHEVNLLALQQAGVSEVAIIEQQEHQAELEAAAADLQTAAVWHQARWRHLVGLVLAGLLFGWLMPWGYKERNSEARSEIQEPATGTLPTSWGDAAFTALWMMVMVLGFVGGAVLIVFDGTQLEALGVSLAFGIPATGLATNSVKNPSLQKVALIGWLLGLVGLSAALSGLIPAGYRGSWDYTVIEWWMPVALGCGAAGVLLGIWLRIQRVPRSFAFVGIGMGRMARYVIVPTVSGLLCLHIEFTTPDLFWPALLGMLIGGDSRWFGAASGLRLTGQTWIRSMSSALPLADAGAIQVIIGFVLMLTGWIQTPGALLMVLAGALLCDLTVGKRGHLLLRLQTEFADSTPDDDDEEGE